MKIPHSMFWWNLSLWQKIIFLMTIHHPDENLSIWWNDDLMKFITLTETYFSDGNSSPRWKFINMMKWWKFIPHDIVGNVDSSLWWIFITLKNMKKNHYSKRIHPSEFIAILRIHYSDENSSNNGNSSPWLIRLF